MLHVDVTKALGATTVEAAFDSAGGVTALFGPSGAGKTSLINMIAGLLKPDRGRIELDGEALDDTAQRIHIPAHRRRIGYVFQDARLFPHLSVEQNLDYGRRMNGLPFDAAEHVRIAQLLDLEALRQRRPGRLSGGEKQRVALGRALLSRPRLLLLDEPLGSLDDERKAEILPYLMRLRDQAGVPMVYVSHDADEVRRLATQVIRLQNGTIAAQGGLEVLPQPRS
ncbi:molybdenum ABC transporter ATP-binding protein [Bradyrhizobium sp. LHD-71]|uniref:molybdenum ABC transporter ATP-binding protein n=1 Tax=Bradyrhizobium sp. LHD-71 TaxID=3072141 RepID=UPI00280DA8E2|nr:molybdenum ABC transporter ATP-binding protein [Bradyrhizobium sp. LHD-71]MDQ8727309.1 molybdenum ABC transporter ATP-binding protein [Bradyrhizobium sp. LHD-71]